MAIEISVTQARAELAELVNRVVYTDERVVLTRHGKPLVALVPAAEVEASHDQPDEHTAPTPLKLSSPAEHAPQQPQASPGHMQPAAQHRQPPPQ